MLSSTQKINDKKKTQESKKQAFFNSIVQSANATSQQPASDEATQPSAENKFGIRENDVVLAAIPVSHKQWLQLTDVCIATGAELILPAADADAETLAETIVSRNVTVVASTTKNWRVIYDNVNLNPGSITHLRAILLDNSQKPRFRNLLILSALSKGKIEDVFAAYQKAPWLKKQLQG